MIQFLFIFPREPRAKLAMNPHPMIESIVLET
jgi:hypothetical protein